MSPETLAQLDDGPDDLCRHMTDQIGIHHDVAGDTDRPQQIAGAGRCHLDMRSGDLLRREFDCFNAAGGARHGFRPGRASRLHPCQAEPQGKG